MPAFPFRTAALMLLAAALPTAAQTTPPATPTAAPTTAPATAPGARVAPAVAYPGATMPAIRPAGPITLESLLPGHKVTFDISNQPIGEVAIFIAKSYNFRLIDPYRLKQPVTMKFHEPLSAAEAIHLLDQTLLTLGYTLLREARTDPPIIELRIVSTNRDPNLPALPVHTETDPAKIPATDEFRTQVITVNHIEPQTAADLIAPVLDGKSNVTVNKAARTLIITDTSNRIRTAASLIQVLEKQAAERQARPATDR